MTCSRVFAHAENMQPVIETSNLTKVYNGVHVVNNLTLTLAPGSVHGLLGPNGSGKSTTMKMMLGLVRPTSGCVRIFGEDMNRTSRPRLMRHIGALIEQPSGYQHLTGAENMRIVGGLVGASQSDIDSAISLVRLDNHMNKLVKNFSLGMKQRLGIAMAVVRQPQVLILDEPTNGLDPAGMEEIRQLIVSLARDYGRTILVSSHLLSEIEKMASYLTIIHGGSLIYTGTQTALYRSTLPDVVVHTPHAHSAASALPRWQPTVGHGTLTFANLTDDDVAALCAHLVAHEIPIHQVVRQRRSLEDVFISLTGRGNVQ